MDNFGRDLDTLFRLTFFLAAIGVLASIALTGVAIWAVIELVQHFT